MNNFEYLRSLSFDDFAKFLDSIDSDNAPWHEWIAKTYCDKCPTIRLRLPNEEWNGLCHEYAFCEFNGYCKFIEDKDFMKNPVVAVKKWLLCEHDEHPHEENKDEELTELKAMVKDLYEKFFLNDKK